MIELAPYYIDLKIFQSYATKCNSELSNYRCFRAALEVKQATLTCQYYIIKDYNSIVYVHRHAALSHELVLRSYVMFTSLRSALKQRLSNSKRGVVQSLLNLTYL